MKRKIVVIGGGAIGCCAAYYLTKHASYNPCEDSILILEANEIASGSSGKGGGLIARWAEPECLAQPSFSLHQELADLHNGAQRWGYRRATCADCIMNITQTDTPVPATGQENVSIEDGGASLPTQLDWIYRELVVSYDPVGSENDTAQCEPFSFTSALFDEACKAGAKLVNGHAVQIHTCDLPEGRVVVEYMNSRKSRPEHLLATDVVVAAGPWSSTLVPEASVSGARSHSIVLRPNETLSNNLLFVDVTYTSDSRPQRLTPEVYPRPNGTVYACEAADPTHALPAKSADVVVDSEACERIHTAVAAISPALKDAHLERTQVCYQPIVVFEGRRRKLVGPFLGHTSMPGAYLACGHDSWGISNAPATGKALSELIFDGRTVSTDIESLSIPNVISRARG